MLEQRIINVARRIVTKANSSDEESRAAILMIEEVEQLRSLFTKYDQSVSAEVSPACPKCGSDEVEQLADAWFARHLAGFNSYGAALLDSTGDIRVFEDSQFSCVSCGYQTRNVIEFRPAGLGQSSR